MDRIPYTVTHSLKHKFWHQVLSDTPRPCSSCQLVRNAYIFNIYVLLNKTNNLISLHNLLSYQCINSACISEPWFPLPQLKGADHPQEQTLCIKLLHLLRFQGPVLQSKQSKCCVCKASGLSLTLHGSSVGPQGVRCFVPDPFLEAQSCFLELLRPESEPLTSVSIFVLRLIGNSNMFEFRSIDPPPKQSRSTKDF